MISTEGNESERFKKILSNLPITQSSTYFSAENARRIEILISTLKSSFCRKNSRNTKLACWAPRNETPSMSHKTIYMFQVFFLYRTTGAKLHDFALNRLNFYRAKSIECFFFVKFKSLYNRSNVLRCDTHESLNVPPPCDPFFHPIKITFSAVITLFPMTACLINDSLRHY